MRAALTAKAILNPGETIRLYNLSGRKFYQMIQCQKRLPFIALYNKRKLIIRSEFDKYLESHPEEKERLKNGERYSFQREGILSGGFCAAGRASEAMESTSTSTF